MKHLKLFLISLIKIVLWILDSNHRKSNNIENDVKKFTHSINTSFKSDYGQVTSLYRTVPYRLWEIKTNNKTLLCADKHIIILHNMKTIYTEDLTKGSLIQTDSGIEEVISVKNLNIKVHMYDLNVETENENDVYNHLFYTNGILSHNTTCASAFILWKASMASDDRKETILITANKLSQAQEVLDRIKYSYQLLPRWLCPGVLKWNERTILFDNGSKITCRATTADAGRGLSPTLVYVDEMAFIPKRIAESFMTAIRPTLATGGKLFITSTPMNDEDEFAKIWRDATNHYDDNGNYIENGTGRNGYYAVKSIWSDHPERDAKWEKEFRNSMSDSKFRQEFECEFISSDETLIDSSYISDYMKPVSEIFRIGQTRWFKEPVPNHVYALALDPSMGTGGDPAAIEVFDLTTMEQVAEWRSSITPSIGQVKIILEILYYIHSTLAENPLQKGDPEIYWSFENNACGEGTLVAIELTGIEKFPGTLISDAGKRNGLNTNKSTKNTSCSIFKRLTEKGKFKIYSAPLIAELKNFVSSGYSYKAKIGETDDLVMTTLSIIRIYSIISKWEDNVADESEMLEDIYDINMEPMPFGFV